MLFKKSSKEELILPLLAWPILCIALVPIGIVVYILNEVVRLCVQFLLWRRHGGTVNLVPSGSDAIWNYKTNGNTRTCLITGVHMKNMLDMEVIAASFQRKVLDLEKKRGNVKYRPYDKLTKILVTELGYTCWKTDTAFDVRRHFIQMDKDKLYTEEDILLILSTMVEDMDETKPQWEWIYFPRYQGNKNEEKSLWVLRFHHSYMDGLSTLFLLGHFSDNKPALFFNPVEFKIETWKKVIHDLNTILFGPYLLIKMMILKYRSYWVQHGPFPAGKKNFVSAPTISLNLLKSIRENTGATIPLVVSSSFVAAVKRVLPEKRILKSLRIGEIAAKIPYKNDDPQNRFSSYCYDVSTDEIGDNATDFCDYIATTRRDRVAGMLGPESQVTYFAFLYFGRFPAFILPLILNGAHYSLFYSNIPAFKEEWRCFGNVIEEFSPWPPMPNQTGITIASGTYNDTLKITGVSDSSWLTKEELESIFKEVPKIIEQIAKNSYIPQVLPSEESAELEKFNEKLANEGDDSKKVRFDIPENDHEKYESDDGDESDEKDESYESHIEESQSLLKPTNLQDGKDEDESSRSEEEEDEDVDDDDVEAEDEDTDEDVVEVEDEALDKDAVEVEEEDKDEDVEDTGVEPDSKDGDVSSSDLGVVRRNDDDPQVKMGALLA